MKIELTKEEWDYLSHQLHDNNEMLLFDKDSEHIAQSILEKLGGEWVDDESNATLPCGYKEGLEPRFTYD